MASNAGAVRAGKAFVELFADDSQLVRGLKGAEKRLKAWGKSISSVGATLGALGGAVLAPMLAAAKSFADVGSQLNDMSARTGVSAEALQELGFGAEQTGASVEDLETGLRKMQKSVGSAASGSQSAQDALAALGLTVGDLMSLNPEQQFKLIGDRLSRIGDPTLKAAAAMELFGKSGTKLLPMLEGGKAGLAGWAKQARDLGIVLSNDDVKAADDFGDKLDIIGKVIGVTTAKIGAALVPVLMDVAQVITDVATKVSAWISENRPLISIIFQVAAGVAAAGVALVALGGAISAVGTVLGVLATGLTVIGGLIGFLLSPIGLVIAGMTALGAIFLTQTQAGGDALDWLGKQFQGLLGTAKTTFGGIADALKAGDIGLAMKILALGLKVEWVKLTTALTTAWIDFQKVFAEITGEIDRVWRLFVAGAVDAFTKLISAIINARSLLGAGGFVIDLAIGDPEKFKKDMENLNKEVQAGTPLVVQESIDKQKQRLAELAKARKDAAAGGAEEIAKAQMELGAAVKQAADAAQAAQDARPKAMQDKAKFPDISGLAPEIDKAAKKIEVKGTFAAAGTRGLGSDSVQDRQLETQKQIQKELQIANRRGTVAFEA